MNGTQFYLAIAVAPVTTIVIVLIGVWLNNQNMNKRLALNDFKDLLKSEIGRMESRLEGRTDSMESALLRRIAGLDARISRIEEKLNIR